MNKKHTYIYKNRLMPADVRTLFEEINTNTNIAVNDFVEDIYSGEEGALNEYLNDLIQGRTNFYYNPFSDKNTMFDNSKRAFLYYVAAQYFRTKAAEKRLSIGLLKAINDDKLVSFYKENGIDVNCLRPENMCYHISWFLRGQLADALYDKNSHLTILLNDTDLPFVTSDQPVINTFADYQNMENAVNDIMLYYPITPKVAITINDNNAIERIELNRNKVDEYNQLIVNASYESVFSNKREVLENYLSKT